MRLTSAYATEDDGSYIKPPKRKNGTTAIQGCDPVGTASSTGILTLDVYGIAVDLDPATSKVTVTRMGKSRTFRAAGFTSWRVLTAAPTHEDPQVVTVQLGNVTLEVFAVFPGVVRIVDPGNSIVFTEGIPPNAVSNADVDPHELNADDWWLVSHAPWTLTAGQLIVEEEAHGHVPFVSIIYDPEEKTRAWRHFLSQLHVEDLRIQPTAPWQMARVFWLMWWKWIDGGNQRVFAQTNFDTMSGKTLRYWARLLGIESSPLSTDERLRVRVKGRILARHGIIQPARVVRAIRTMLGVTTPGGLQLIENLDSNGVEKPRFLRVVVATSLLEAAGYASSEYLSVLQDIHDELERGLAATVRLELQLTGGAVYDTDNYDAGAVYS